MIEEITNCEARCVVVRTPEPAAGRLPRVQGQPKLPCETVSKEGGGG